MILKNLLQKKKHDGEEHQHPALHDGSSHGGGGHDDESNWLVSYADMMTLLCGFFIMLFSMAKLDEPKYEAMKEAVAKEFGGQYKSEAKELAAFATQILQEAGIEKDASVKVTNGGAEIIFNSTIFFETLSSELSPGGRTILDKLLTGISERQKALSKDYKIVVEGHTDGRPVVGGSYPSNWELSGARASRVVRMFLDKDYKPANMTAIGYADTRPEIPHRLPSGEWDEKALSKNRRVVIRVLDPKVDAIPFPESPVAPETESRTPAGAVTTPEAEAATATAATAATVTAPATLTAASAPTTPATAPAQTAAVAIQTTSVAPSSVKDLQTAPPATKPATATPAGAH